MGLYAVLTPAAAVQFAFLAFLLGQSLEGFGQWKALLHLLLACEQAPLGPRAGLYARALAALRAQLQHCLASGRHAGCSSGAAGCF